MHRLALVLALALAAGCLGSPEAPSDDTRAEGQTDDAGTRPITQQFTGSATGTPAQPFTEDFAFEVPRGAVGVNGTLAWERPPVDVPLGIANALELALVDPDGEVVSEGRTDPEGRLTVVTIDPPSPGTWIFRVSSNAAIDTPFTLDAAAELIVPEHNTIVKSLSLGQRSFYEVNLILEKDASFAFSFNASAPVNWDVHSHPEGGVKEWETGTGATGASSFTAPERDVYSILWENPGALPAELAFEVEGRFRVHSHSG